MTVQFIKRVDNSSGIYLTRYLEQVMPRIYEKRYPALHGSNGEDVPINPSLEVGAQELVEEFMNERGSADLIDFAADDFPTVDIDMQERRFPVKVYGSSFRYNEREIAAAARHPRFNLRERRITAARRKIEVLTNKVTYYGEPRVPGFYGLLNNPSVPTDTIDDVNFYTDATPDELCQLVFDITNRTDEETNMVEETSVVIVPNTLYNYMISKRVTDGNDKTVLQYVMENSPYIKSIRRRNELRADMLFENGVEANDNYERILAYSVNSELLERFVEPIQVTQPLRLTVMNWVIAMFTVVSPVIIHYPLAMRYTRILKRPEA